MSDGAKPGGKGLVEIPLERLFAIIGAALDDGLAAAILDRYGREVVLMTAAQAEAFKAFVRDDVATHDAPAFDAPVGGPAPDPGRAGARRAKLVGPRLKAALPADCGHCRPRR